MWTRRRGVVLAVFFMAAAGVAFSVVDANANHAVYGKPIFTGAPPRYTAIHYKAKLSAAECDAIAECEIKSGACYSAQALLVIRWQPGHIGRKDN